MKTNSQSSEKQDAPKGENPPMEKVAAKVATESGKRFQGKGKEKRG